MTTLSIRLKDVRTRAGLSQPELGAKIGVTGTQVYRYEAGDNEPTVGKLASIARELGVSIDYLCGLTDNPSPARYASDLSEGEQRLLNAYRAGDMGAVADLFAEKLRNYRAAQASVAGS